MREVVSVDTLADLRSFLETHRVFSILGKGSNTLINPETSIPTFLQISPQWLPPEVRPGNRLLAGAGCTVHQVMKACATAGLTGLEFAAGVPASIGGMVAMNFGCYGRDVSQVVTRVQVVTFSGEDLWLAPEELGFGYRHSRVQTEPWIVVAAEFQLESADMDTVKATQARFVADRLAKQPLRARTFGSTFKNPPNQYAGALIESIGFKGKPVGAVGFSAQHANFLENLGGGTFDAALHLIETVQAQVWATHQVVLETEVKLVR